jgi:hypothetical protein
VCLSLTKCELETCCSLCTYLVALDIWVPPIRTDKNQYVHRRDSVSLASLSEQEIQKRMQLGLVTPAAATSHHAAAVDTDVELEDWQDIMENDDDDANENSTSTIENGGSCKVATLRRSSVDLGHMSVNVHDMAALHHSSDVATQSFSGVLHDHQNPLKRQRYRQPSIASISEEEPLVGGALGSNTVGDEEEVATVDGSSSSSMEEMAEME